MFTAGSRYHSVPTKTITRVNGTQINYKARRFLPPVHPSQFALKITAAANDRLDLLATKTLGDPLKYWQICDSNYTLNPANFLQPGRVIRVLPPQANLVRP
jgi:hypothetical protein